MELNSESVEAPARPAATVVMLRDAPAGIEVFLLKRHGLSDVLGGAYVFPGGKVDPLDAELDPEAHLDQSQAEMRLCLNEGELGTMTATSLYVAALREVFEECGVLLAGPDADSVVGDVSGRQWQVERAALDAVCRFHGLAEPARTLSAEALSGLTAEWKNEPLAVAKAFSKMTDATVLRGMEQCAKVGTARKLGLKTGDRIRLTSPAGSIEGRAQVIEGIHPQVFGVSNTLTRISPNTGKERVPASESRTFSRLRSSSPNTRTEIMSPEPSL